MLFVGLAVLCKQYRPRSVYAASDQTLRCLPLIEQFLGRSMFNENKIGLSTYVYFYF